MSARYPIRTAVALSIIWVIAVYISFQVFSRHITMPSLIVFLAVCFVLTVTEWLLLTATISRSKRAIEGMCQNIVRIQGDRGQSNHLSTSNPQFKSELANSIAEYNDRVRSYNRAIASGYYNLYAYISNLKPFPLIEHDDD